MNKRICRVIAAMLALFCLSGCAATEVQTNPSIKERMLAGAAQLEKSELLYFEDGLTITGMGVNFSGSVTQRTDNFFWLAIENMTGVTLDIRWENEENYISALSASLLGGTDNLPDILNATDFGVMDLADDGAIIMLDDYIDLMPDIVAAVGENRLEYLRQADGHIYTIPSITNVPGAQTMMVRKDWLDKLGMSEPQTWDQWVALWRAIRDNDLNGNGDPNDEIPFASQYGSDSERCLLPLLNAFGIKTSGDTQFCRLDDGTYTMVYEHPRYPEFLEAVQQLYAEGLIASSYDTMYGGGNDAPLNVAMDENRLGTTFNWAERCRTSAQALRDAGVTDALWEAVAPITGPDGTRMTPERAMVMPMWCITSAARSRGKVEDIIRFFNWYYTQEGSYLYSYGIEGVSYEIQNGMPVMDSELTAEGFTAYRNAGCNIESFGGLWQEGAFIQCLFEGNTVEAMNELTEEFYKGIGVVNNGYFYAAPQTYETPAYTQYRTALISKGVCVLRDQAIKGEITVEAFFEQYEDLKQQGLQQVIDEVAEAAGR